MSGAELYGLVMTTMIGIIGFFVKKAFGDIEKKASKEDMEKLEKRVSAKAEKSSVDEMKKEIENLRSSVDEMKFNYLTKEDFLREFVKLDSNLQKITDIMISKREG